MFIAIQNSICFLINESTGDRMEDLLLTNTQMRAFKNIKNYRYPKTMGVRI